MTIGRPIANTELYVLDEHDRIVPPGVFGTLFIGGDGLAKGYFDRADLTARSFRCEVSPAGRPPQRLYSHRRPGPTAAPPGDLEPRGRNDRRSMLRGFRIELEEIESALRQATERPRLRGAVASRYRFDPALVAYVVAAASNPAAIRADLGAAPARLHGAHPLGRARRLAAHGGRQARPQRPADTPEAPRPINSTAERPASPIEAATAAVGWRCSAGMTSGSRIRCSQRAPICCMSSGSPHACNGRTSPSTRATFMEGNHHRSPGLDGFRQEAQDGRRGSRKGACPCRFPVSARGGIWRLRDGWPARRQPVRRLPDAEGRAFRAAPCRVQERLGGRKVIRTRNYGPNRRHAHG